MNRKTVGIFSYPWPKAYEYGKTPMRKGSLIELYRKSIWLKANPRSKDYMQSLFLERWSEGVFINIDKNSEWTHQIADADTVVLLYPDSIGLGFSQIESNVYKAKKKWAAIRVLNGRRRQFLFNLAIQRQIYLRRFLERSMLLEVAAIICFLLLTPPLLIIDWIRGRR